MAGVILGTASLLSSSASLIASLQHLTSRLKFLSGPRSVEVREKDRRRLSALHRRIDALSEPLSFFLVASESSVGRDMALYARRLVNEVGNFLDRELRFEFVDEHKALTTASAETVDFYLSELHFVLVGLGALNFSDRKIQGSRSLPLESLLRASYRISDHRQVVGDLLAVECANSVRLRLVRGEDRKFVLSVSDQTQLLVSLSHNFRSNCSTILWDETCPSSASSPVSDCHSEDGNFVLVEEEGRPRAAAAAAASLETETKSFEFISCCSDGWTALDVVFLLRLCAYENDTNGQSHLVLSDDSLCCLLTTSTSATASSL